MKHQETKPESKTSNTMSLSTSRHRTNHSKPKESPNGNGNIAGGLSISPAIKGRPKPVNQPDVKIETLKTRRSLVVNRAKSGEESVESQKGREVDESRVVGRSVNRPAVVEQFARPRRRISRKKEEEEEAVNEEKRCKEFEKKLELNEVLVKNLQSEMIVLKVDLDKAHSLNAELELKNKKLSDLNAELELKNEKLSEDLAAAEVKLAALSSSNNNQKESVGEYQSPKFKDIQKLIANKLEHSMVKKETIHEPCMIKTKMTSSPPPPLSPACQTSKVTTAERKVPAGGLVVPPPPPLPPRLPARAAPPRKTSPVAQFYQSLTKQDGKRDRPVSGNQNKPTINSAHNSIVGEIQNRSAHLIAIKADIETKGEFINGLIQKVLAAAFTDVEDVVKFIHWIDSELASLADERAVLKHFKWPERKADAMREASVEYRELKTLEMEISSFNGDITLPCGAALKKMASLLDKSERSVQRLIKLRNSVMRSYQDCKIPVDWMLDSGIMSKIKQGFVKLAKTYMKRVKMELELARHSDRESTQEALLLQGLHFAYRAHQFAGGLDTETLCAIEEIRQRVPVNLGGSREVLAGIPSS